MKNDKPQTDAQGAVEGEGNYTGTRRYNEHVKEHLANNDPQKLAEEAKRALQGDEREALEEAERRAKRGPSPKP